MRAQPTRFAIPPREGALEQFPTDPPWEIPLSMMANWWIRPQCGCGAGAYPLRLMAAERGWNLTLREIMPRLVCRTCGQRPSAVWLVDNPVGDIGRHGAAERRLQLL